MKMKMKIQEEDEKFMLISVVGEGYFFRAKMSNRMTQTTTACNYCKARSE